MQTNLRRLLFLLLATVLLGCNNESQESTQQLSRQVRNVPSVTDQKIAANACRIVATILSIDSEWRSSNPNDPCSKVPCRATVRVDSVLGYGTGAKPVGVGERLSTHFKFTLNPSKELLPNMSLSLPGLALNSRFRADLKSMPTLELGDSSPQLYLIEIYKKLN